MMLYIYLIGVICYLVASLYQFSKHRYADKLLQETDLLITTAITIVALIWPVSVVYNLYKKARK